MEVAFTQQSVARLANTLHLLLRDRLLALPADDGLLDELANVRFRETAAPRGCCGWTTTTADTTTGR